MVALDVLVKCPIQAKENLYSQAHERGYQVLGTYINNDTKIEMQCPENHILEITPHSFKYGRGCAKCADHCPIQAKGNFYSEAVERDYQVLGTYINNDTKIEMQCPDNHRFETTPHRFKNGHGLLLNVFDLCPIQAKEKFYIQAHERGCQILGTYVNNRTKVRMQCPENHQFEISPDSFQKWPWLC